MAELYTRALTRGKRGETFSMPPHKRRCASLQARPAVERSREKSGRSGSFLGVCRVDANFLLDILLDIQEP